MHFKKIVKQLEKKVWHSREPKAEILDSNKVPTIKESIDYIYSLYPIKNDRQ